MRLVTIWQLMLDDFWMQLGIAVAVVASAWMWMWKIDAPECGGNCEQGDKPCNCGGE